MTARKQTTIVSVVLLGLLAIGGGPSVTIATAMDAFNANANSYVGSPVQGTIPTVAGSEMDATTLPASVSADWWSAVQEDIRQAEYHITWQEQTYLPDWPAPSELRAGAYQAPNRAHNLRTYFTSTGIRVISRIDPTPSWEWGLTLTRYGYADDLQAVTPAELVAEGNRIEYQRGDLTEWYVNDECGLEQGFTLKAPPLPARERGLGGEGLVLELVLSGDLTPMLTDDSAIEFTTPPSTSSGQGGGARVLRYADLHAYDATGHVLPAHMSLVPLNNASCFKSHALHLTVDDSTALYPITIDPLATSPNWMAEGDQAGARFGSSVGTAGDVNGDGYADVIVGAKQYDNGQTDEGRAFVYYGSAAGLSTTAAWTAEGDQAYARFGESAGTAGDINGDGYADVIVGAHWYDNGETDEGMVFLYHGSASGLTTMPSWTAESNQAYADFGCALGTAGDVNGDGYAEVIIGAQMYDNGETNEGMVFLYHGSATGLSTVPNWTAEGNQAGALLGYFAAGTAGDVNGDGYADVIVGAPRYDNGETDEGRAFVYYGSAIGLAASPDWTVEINQAYAFFGKPVGTAGDVNGDGYVDVIIGAEEYVNGQWREGGAFVYHGSAAGLSPTPDWTAEGNQNDARFSSSLGTAGDVNGDGYADVIVGAKLYNNGQYKEGRAFVYYGSATGLSATADWTAESDQVGAELGTSVGTAGDVNGDGYADVIVGADYYDHGEGNEGMVFLFQSQSPAEVTQELIDIVEDFNLQQGIENSLEAKLDTVLQVLDDLNEHNDVAAVNSLQAFVNAVEAQRGKALTDTQADQLIEMAQAIISSLSR
jgi:hypothetical protein